MKKYLVLSRAISNFGDFLIFERGLSLIKFLKPGAEIITGKAWISLEEQFSSREIASFDAIIIPGGPGIRPDAYPSLYPLSRQVFKNNIPIYFLGGGAKIYPYFGKRSEEILFHPDSIAFFKYLNRFAPIGVRDVITKRVLEKSGFSAQVNGCPAWFKVPLCETQRSFPLQISRVVFSVPANDENVAAFLKIVEEVKTSIAEAQIFVSFNHGWRDDKNKWMFKQIEKLGCEAIDMSGSTKGVCYYDSMDIHIGYRVHTHIYFLSSGKPSFLIPEDSRGWGILETIKTPSLKIDSSVSIKRKFCAKILGLTRRFSSVLPNNYYYYFQDSLANPKDVAQDVLSLVNQEVEKNFSGFEGVVNTIRYYFENKMKPYILTYIP